MRGLPKDTHISVATESKKFPNFNGKYQTNITLCAKLHFLKKIAFKMPANPVRRETGRNSPKERKGGLASSLEKDEGRRGEGSVVIPHRGLQTSAKEEEEA